MLLGFVVAYIICSVSIGLYAGMRVKGSSDFVLAGRSLPLYVTIATVFATWFGSEAVLGIPATFMEEGLGGIVADPFGAGFCLIFVGMFFARRLYRMKLLTIGDFYKQKYGRLVEILVSVFICLSYLGWVAAQVVALGLVITIVSGDIVSFEMAMAIGLAAVVAYTVIGGMWAVAYTDLIQMSLILLGLVFVACLMSLRVDGGAIEVIQQTQLAGRFDFWPDWTFYGVLGFLGTFITLALGSIPQQDVFQRVMSANSEKNAVVGTVTGGAFYILFCFIPIFIMASIMIVEPQILEAYNENGTDIQRLLPSYIMDTMPIAIQVLFFGALMSAIMSTASGTLLAPAAIFSENIIRPILKLDDKHLLITLRLCVLLFAVLVFGYAYFSSIQDVSIFEMVENAYLLPLCGAFVPLVFGLYWSKSNNGGAICSIVMGVVGWLLFEFVFTNISEMIPAQLIGVCLAMLGMVFGSVIFVKKSN